MKFSPFTIIAALLVAIVLVGVGGNAIPAGAQTKAPRATNIQVRDGSNPGEVIITWNAAPGVSYYRIGYVNMVTDYPLAKASRTGDWKEAFVYADVEAQNFEFTGTTYTLRRLEQGARHAFAVLTNNQRYGQPTWPSNPDWVFLTPHDWGGSCPAADGSPPTTGPRLLSFNEIQQRVRPALASITVEYSDGSESGGTGFVVDSTGLVVTNRHVVGDADTVMVRMDGPTGSPTEYTGRVLGRGILADVALVKLQTNRSFTPLPLANSDATPVGTEVTAWGFPLGRTLGVDPTVTRGIVSAKRPWADNRFLQTDAAVNAGNSGGPLVDAYGQVVGVNTFGFVGDVDLINFALASNEVSRLLNTLAGGGPEQVTYRNLRFDYGYSIGIPKGWYLDRENDFRTSFFTYTGERVGWVSTWLFEEPYADKNTELRFLADYLWNDRLPERAQQDGWTLLQKISRRQIQFNGETVYRLEYLRQSSPEYCISRDVVLISLSGSFPNKPLAFSTGNGICDDVADAHTIERERILESFRP